MRRWEPPGSGDEEAAQGDRVRFRNWAAQSRAGLGRRGGRGGGAGLGCVSTAGISLQVISQAASDVSGGGKKHHFLDVGLLSLCPFQSVHLLGCIGAWRWLSDCCTKQVWGYCSALSKSVLPPPLVCLRSHGKVRMKKGGELLLWAPPGSFLPSSRHAESQDIPVHGCVALSWCTRVAIFGPQ